MNILITGINGFIGSHLVNHFKSKKHNIVGISRNPADESIKVVYTDLSKSLEFDDNVDLILHAAAQNPYNCKNDKDYYNNNVLVTNNIVNFAKVKKVKKIIYFSGISIYGDVKENIIDEKTKIINPEPYGISKLEAEKILLNSGIPSVILRMPGVAGKNAHSMLIAQLTKKIINGDHISIYNPDSMFNNILHISDLCNFVDNLVKNDFNTDIINLGSEKPVKFIDAIKYIISQLNSKSKVSIDQSDRKSFTISINKAKKYGFDPMSTMDALNKYISEDLK